MSSIRDWQDRRDEVKRTKIQRLIECARPIWDRASVRPHIRAVLNNLLLCGTPALGAEVFMSIAGEKLIVYHTCKSSFCPTCGYFKAIRFQQEVVNSLPDIPYRGLILTIPDRFWEILRVNRQLRSDLVTLGGGVLSDLARELGIGSEVLLIVVLHTFNPELKFKPHLHIVVGLTGLGLDGNSLVKSIFFPKDMLQQRWRNTILDRLKLEALTGRLRSDLSQRELLQKIDYERGALWHVEDHRCKTKEGLLTYAARYIGRPPIANTRILEFDADHVRFKYRDKLDDDRIHEETISTQEFISRLIEHIREPYEHGIGYFGLLSPRAKSSRYPAYLRLLGQQPQGSVPRLRWPDALNRSFGANPLMDTFGNTMKWSHRLPSFSSCKAS